MTLRNDSHSYYAHSSPSRATQDFKRAADSLDLCPLLDRGVRSFRKLFVRAGVGDGRDGAARQALRHDFKSARGVIGCGMAIMRCRCQTPRPKDSSLDGYQAWSPFNIARKRLTGNRGPGRLGVLKYARQDHGKRRPDLRQLHTPSYHEHGLGRHVFPVDSISHLGCDHCVPNLGTVREPGSDMPSASHAQGRVDKHYQSSFVVMPRASVSCDLRLVVESSERSSIKTDRKGTVVEH